MATNGTGAETVCRTKRSARVGLTGIASALGALTVAGCGSEAATLPVAQPESGPKTQVLAFSGVFDCAAEGTLDKEQCEKGRTEALATASQSAPRFAGQGDCEAEWGAGACMSQKSEGRSFFIPFMTGFLVGNLLGDGKKRQILPLFRRAGESGYSTANGVRLGYGGSPGKYLAVARTFEKAKTVSAIKADTGAVARGGMTWGQDSSEESSRGTRVRVRARGYGG